MKRKSLFISTILSTVAMMTLASCDVKQKQTETTKTGTTPTTTEVTPTTGTTPVTTTGNIPTSTVTDPVTTGIIPTSTVTAPLTTTGTTPTTVTTTIETTVYEKGTYNNPLTATEALEIAGTLAVDETSTDVYYIKGTVSDEPTSNYCNFNLSDGTNQIYSYGLYTEDGTKAYGSKKQISALPIAMGDEIIVLANLKNYQGQLEMVNARLYYVKSDGSLKTLALNTEFNTGNYDSNFGSLTTNNYQFAYYRAYGRDYSDDYFLKLYDNCSLKTNEALDSTAGAFYNLEPIYDMQTIKVSYVSSSKVTLKLGQTTNYSKTFELPASDGSNVLTFDITDSLTNCNYFSFETIDSDVFFKSVTIDYTKTMSSTDTIVNTVNGTRIKPVTFEGTKVEGVSKVSVPTKIKQLDNNKYQILETKEYTYMTYDYLTNNSIDPTNYIYTDPVDVINYYNAFKVPPVNFAAGSNINQSTFGVYLVSKSNARSLFGDAARQVSMYSRTDGYVGHVPYLTPLEYYEFDIALDSSYTIDSRGVGRLVVFKNGFNDEFYGNDPVSLYTEDHYVTFKEFSNAGYFNEAFDSISNSYISRRISVNYGLLNTLTLA